MQQLATVALVGRPNAGKSTLFNRLSQARHAVVEPTPGVTRDRLYADVDWNGLTFQLVDTGGLANEGGDPFAPLVAEQVEVALREADVAILVVDAAAGLLPSDADLAERLRRWGRPVVVCANKAESPQAPYMDFYELGLGEPIRVSALHGEGTGDLLDAVVALLPEGAEEAEPAEVERIRVAFVGRPNVGKSSLVNRLLGRQRLITSELAGTTRDAVDVPWDTPEGSFLLVDTPGVRRPARVEEELEKLSVQRALRAAERAQVVVLVLDAQELVTEQDQRIAGFAHDRGRASVVLVNKADLVPSLELARIHGSLPFLDYAPVLAISARTGSHVGRLVPTVLAASAAHQRRLPTAELNRVLRDAVAGHAPPSVGGKPLRLYYATQVAVGPPTLLIFVNAPERVRPDYARYLENRLRAVFDLTGTPLRLRFRARPRIARNPTGAKKTRP